ncbi:MAG: UDP-N-acetylglucosamine--N-acetylmuramyl-(pentapeptide) pyrophosphoryl-undecaprenol N-acetylglucosamine transferase, partial [Thermoleophilia bacterium]
VVLVFGVSQGAQSLNRACLEAFGSAALDLQVLNICGPRNFDEMQAALVARAADVERYRLLPYTEDLAHAMAVADLVVGRAGGSVAEIAALGRPAILVPYPYATADHQSKNAAWMAAAGAAVVVADADLDGRLLARLVGELLADETRLARMAAASRAAGRRDATQAVADEVESLLARSALRPRP